MDIVFRVLYAAYGKGTHHKLALDALAELPGPDGDAWRRLFLSRAEKFAAGSKAPDDQFKDFTNHVLHPRDGYWGGAPAAANGAYGKLVAALKAADWDEAAWQAGILSHYVADPLMPFHTGQSEAENNVHRAAEWSINRAYDTLRAEALKRGAAPVVSATSGADWLGDLMRAGATRSNQDYERLLAHYDITRGVVDPPAGLDKLARRIVSELLLQASATCAQVLGRALAESGVKPPDVSLLLPAILAALNIPKAIWLKRLADQDDRKTVEAMYDELMATGKVEKNLPADDRMVKERHAAEVLGSEMPAATMPVPIIETAAAIAPSTPEPAVSSVVASLFSMEPGSEPAHLPAAVNPLAVASVAPKTTAASTRTEPTRATPNVEAHKPPRAKLALTDDLEAAPSIGPKLAERFAAVGIRTVGDFLAADPGVMEEGLDHRGVDAKEIAEWQRQARLVMDIPGINGTQARLLTGAGYASAKAVASADPVALCAAVLKYAASGPGRQILRDHPPPETDKIAGWVRQAKAA